MKKTKLAALALSAVLTAGALGAMAGCGGPQEGQTTIRFWYTASISENRIVNEMIDGFATALQYMHPGDRWEIWIPQALGYGSAGSASRQQSDGTYSTEIKPYTTLIYEIEVTRVTEP